jgi:SWI/SNF-related matrix-associated actin-dependent regulator of chromatin subfamily A member 5
MFLGISQEHHYFFQTTANNAAIVDCAYNALISHESSIPYATCWIASFPFDLISASGLCSTAARLLIMPVTAHSLLSKVLPQSRIQHKMSSTPVRRNQMNSTAGGEASDPSPFQTPRMSRSHVDLREASADGGEAEPATENKGRSLRPRPPSASPAHVLRSRKSKNGSHKATGNGRRRSTRSKAGNTPDRPIDLDEITFTPVMTSRNAVRHHIADTTAKKRDQFFIAHKDLFLPLLPDNNHVKKISERYEALSDEDKLKIGKIVPYEEIKTQSKGIKATMKPYQLSGLSFMLYLHRNGLSGILGDEMGLGKTLQTLSLIQYLKENEPTPAGHQVRPFLVVCPLSVLSSWMAEARKWAPDLKVLRFHGPVKERDRLKKIAAGEIDIYGNMTTKAKTKINARRAAAGRKVISLDSDSEDENVTRGVDVVVTTYESYLAEQGWFKRAFVWRYVALDEGHKIKNDSALVSKALQGLQAEYRLILTGTPLQNNLSELWALLHWLYQDVFPANSSELFKESFDLGRGKFSKTVVDSARRLLELIMIRRMKNSPGVDLNLPPKTEVLLFVPLSPMQRFWYTRLITRADQGLLEDLFRDAKSKEQTSIKVKDVDESELDQKSNEELVALAENFSEAADGWKESKEILMQTVQREQEETVVDNKSAWQKLMNLLMQLRKVSLSFATITKLYSAET